MLFNKIQPYASKLNNGATITALGNNGGKKLGSQKNKLMFNNTRTISNDKKLFLNNTPVITNKLNDAILEKNQVQSMASVKESMSAIKNLFVPNPLVKMEQNANNSPLDANVQAEFLHELNKSNPSEVKKRFESGKYAINDETKKEYLKSLIALKEFDKLLLSEFAQSTNTVNTATASTIPAMAFSNANSNFNQSGPITVQLAVSKWDRFWALCRAFAFVGMFSLAAWYLVFADEEKKSTPFNISNAHTEMASSDHKFDDVRGIDDAKQELKEVVEYLRNPKRFTNMGARLPKGVMLVGPPGTGKTLMARAIAGEAGVPFLYCSGSAFDEMYVGVGPKRIRSLFEDARRLSPCIIFIDEIDALGMNRKSTASASYAKESTLNQLLTELDGFKQTEGIIIIGATNFPESLDPALTRPGRFDKQITIPPPDIKGRKEILDFYLKKTVQGPDVDSKVLARGTPGFTGADLSNLINLAAIKAVVQNKKHVDMRTLEEAKDDILMGIQRKGTVQTDENRKLTAYHEGGHALVALLSDAAHPLHKATIIQRGSALGVTVQLPETDQVSLSRRQIDSRLAIAMGGRAAEELIFGEGEVTTGASSDFQSATRLAYSMVAKWGMSEKIGTMAVDRKNASDEEKQLIDSEVKQILKKSYDQAKGLLKEHEKELHNIANALLEHETLTGEEIKLAAKGLLRKRLEDVPIEISGGQVSL